MKTNQGSVGPKKRRAVRWSPRVGASFFLDLLTTLNTNFNCEILVTNKRDDNILYSSHAKVSLGMKETSKGKYSFTWMDCIDGRKKFETYMNIKAGYHIWKKPSGFGDEVVLYMRHSPMKCLLSVE